MANEKPELYFRVRDTGAAVFRVDTDNRQRRLDLDQIAVVNTRNGDIRPQGQADLTEAEIDAIEHWIGTRQATLAARELEDMRRTVEHLQMTTHWAQSKASDDALEALTDDLLMAMHDLRSVLVRKKADRLSNKG